MDREKFIFFNGKISRFSPRNIRENAFFIGQVPILKCGLKIVSEYDQEIPQSQTADNPWHREEEPLNHHETPGRQIKQSNQLSLPIKMIAILEWT